MYGCFEPVVIYGWMENNTDFMLDIKWLETNYPFINFYASNVIRNHMYKASYGIECKLTEQGEIIIHDDYKRDIAFLYNLWCDYHRKSKKNIKMPELGYHLVVSGDFEWEHQSYILDID
jgi:hypothetical protein